MTVAINGRFLLDSFGGVKRFATELSARLAQVRDDVVVLIPPKAAGLSIPGLKLQTIGRTLGPLWEQVELPLWLRSHGKPLLLNFAGMAPIAYSRQISVLHDIAPALRPRDFTFPFRVQWQLAVRVGMLRHGRPLVTDSHASQRDIAEHFRVDPKRIDVIHLGADSLASVPQIDVTDPPTERFIAFGRHGAAKNVRVIVDALDQLPASSDIDVAFVGRLDPELEPYAAEKGVAPERLVWRGPVSDDELAGSLAHSTGFIWPSLHEGFGLPPLEAQTLGLPVIASDIPVNREILGDSALYFPAEDPAVLARLMTEVAGNPGLRATYAQRARENAGRFTWDRTTAAWEQLIDRHAD